MPAPAVALRDHQPEVGHVRARRMGVARDRQAADDPPRRLRDEHGRVRRAADRAQVAPLVARRRASRRSEISQPSGSLPTARPSSTSAARVAGTARRDLTTTLDSLDDDAVAAAARVAGGGERAVGAELDPATPPKNRLRPPPANEVVAPARRGGRARPGRSRPRTGRAARRGGRGPGDRLLDAQAVADDVDDDLDDRAAKPQRAGAADDEPRRGRRAATIDGAIPLVKRTPGRGDAPVAARSNSPSMLFSWIAGARDDHAGAGAGRGRQRRRRSRARRRPRCASSRAADSGRRRPAAAAQRPRARARRRAARPARRGRARARTPRRGRASCSRIISTSCADRLGASRSARAARAGRAAARRGRSGGRPTRAAGSTRARARGTARATGRRWIDAVLARDRAAVIPPPCSREVPRRSPRELAAVERRPRPRSASSSSVAGRSVMTSRSPASRRLPLGP